MNRTSQAMGVLLMGWGALAFPGCTELDIPEQPLEVQAALLEVDVEDPERDSNTPPAPPLPPNRSLDGSANNPDSPHWGSVGEPFVRRASFAYADRIGKPAGPNRPNARVISNAIFRQQGSIPSAQGLSDMAGVWALLLSHDLQSFRAAEPEEQFGIPTPPDDDVFPPGSVIPLARWNHDISTGRDRRRPRSQLNNSTSFIDASVVYGIDPTRAGAVRTFVKGGMKTSEGNLLPLNTFGLPNRVPGPNFFLAGDERANTSFGLIALQTLFVREHNRLAAEISAAEPTLRDEVVFQRARRLVTGQLQAITYNEFLPALLGPYAPRGRVSYDARVNATISEVFSVVGFRFGHSTLSPEFVLAYGDGSTVRIPQRDSFFNPAIVRRDGLDPILRGLALQSMQEIDTKIIDDIRNQTVRFDEKIDLFAYDIQSGREFGVPDYNQMRKELGLHKVRNFAGITSNVQLQQSLAAVYGDVRDIDPLVGGLAEDHLPGASLGPLFITIMVQEFERLRRGDRFWYENDPSLSPQDVSWLRGATLSALIRRNTGVQDIADNAFFTPEAQGTRR